METHLSSDLISKTEPLNRIDFQLLKRKRKVVLNSSLRTAMTVKEKKIEVGSEERKRCDATAAVNFKVTFSLFLSVVNECCDWSPLLSDVRTFIFPFVLLQLMKLCFFLFFFLKTPAIRRSLAIGSDPL